jgi:hypothetical protein
MSRFVEGDDDYENMALDRGRWERNARATLKSKRGRKALAEIREALLALPEKRLIEGAMCTVGGVDARLPAMTDEEVRAQVASLAERLSIASLNPGYAQRRGEHLREEREEERKRFAETVAEQGEGVCLVGAYLWHRKVKAGAGPAEAFAALPALFGEDDSCDPLSDTADLAAREAGMAYTLAYELAYRNDETYRQMTPEERFSAFLAWIAAELGDAESPAA